MSRVLTIVCCMAGLTASPGARAAPPVAADSARPEHASAILTVSGMHRSRYESLDPQFRPLLGDDDRVLAMRTSLSLEAAWLRWQVVGELVDSRAEVNDNDSTLNTTVVNTLELLQAVASRSWNGLFATSSSASLRIGRMTADLGSRRLVARSVFRNTLNSFAGVDWTWESASGQAFRAFYFAPMQIRPARLSALLHNEQQVDEVDEGTRLRGLSYERPISKRGDRLHIYELGVEASRSGERKDIETLAARIYRSAAPGRLHYEAELMKQSGRSAGTVGGVVMEDLDHDAGFYHLELGYTLRKPLSPGITVQYDSASGDEDPFDGRNERFDTLYGSRAFDFGPTGVYGPFARSNLETTGIRMTLEPAQAWQVELRLRSHRLASPRDAWTTTDLRDVSGQSGDALGSQFEANAAWHPSGSRLSFGFGAARFSKGEFVRRTAPDLSRASVYYYLGTTVEFLGERSG